MKIYVKDYYNPDGPRNKDLMEIVGEVERDCCLSIACNSDFMLEATIDVIDANDNECLYSCRLSTEEEEVEKFDYDSGIEGVVAIGAENVSIPFDFDYDRYIIDVTIKGKKRESEDDGDGLEDFELEDVVDDLADGIMRRNFNGMIRRND